MKNTAKLAAAALLTMAITACSGEGEAPEAEATTETRMDEVDVIDGTISDDMVDIDTQQETDILESDAEDDSAEKDSDKSSEEESTEKSEE